MTVRTSIIGYAHASSISLSLSSSIYIYISVMCKGKILCLEESRSDVEGWEVEAYGMVVGCEREGIIRYYLCLAGWFGGTGTILTVVPRRLTQMGPTQWMDLLVIVGPSCS